MFLKAGLYIVSTPIGNFDDITLRAISTLKSSDIILCEDTRISQKLLAKHDIRTKLQVYNDHSDEKDKENIINLIKANKIVSLISDTGTPLISDPGYKLLRDLRSLNFHIDIVLGVSSPIAALTLSALPTNTSRITNDNTLHEPKGQIGYDKQEEQLDKTQSVISTTNIVINTYDQENNTAVNHALL